MKNLLNRLLKQTETSKVLTGDLIPPVGKKSVIPPKYSDSMESFNDTWESIYSESNRNYYKGR
jgi:hypothetical protein